MNCSSKVMATTSRCARSLQDAAQERIRHMGLPRPIFIAFNRPSDRHGTQEAPSLAARASSPLFLYFATSLLLYFLYPLLWLILSFSAIIPPHAHPPAPSGNPRPLRAPLLGRQHQRNLRAPLLLRRLFLPRVVSPRKTPFLHPANWHPGWHFWRSRLVSSHFRRHRGGLPWISTRRFSRLPHPERLVFPSRLHRLALARSRPQCHALGTVCRHRSAIARAGNFAG